MSVNSYEGLAAHFGHSLDIAKYGDENIAIECLDCNEVLLDFNKEGKE